MIDQLDEYLDKLLAREGGFVNDPNDPGGATNMGITAYTLARYRGDSASAEDIEKLTREEAKAIYARFFWFGASISDMPSHIQEHMLDIAVLNGSRTAIRLLQQAINVLSGAPIDVDGFYGPLTHAALHAPDISGWGNLFNDALADRRTLRFIEVVKSDPSLLKFLKGWILRTNLFRTYRV